MLFASCGTHTRAYGSSIVLQLPLYLLALTLNAKWRVLEFSSELKAQDSPEFPIVQALNNPIIFFLLI